MTDVALSAECLASISTNLTSTSRSEYMSIRTTLSALRESLDWSIYSSIIREVFLVPNRQWGEGLLGCGVGYGLLHRIPSQPVNSRNIEAILDQNLLYDGEVFSEERDLQMDSTVVIPADLEGSESGGQAGYRILSRPYCPFTPSRAKTSR